MRFGGELGNYHPVDYVEFIGDLLPQIVPPVRATGSVTNDTDSDVKDRVVFRVGARSAQAAISGSWWGSPPQTLEEWRLHGGHLERREHPVGGASIP